ncbi:MAG: hypothetical protein OEY52_06785 [Gammaproteobacteria bacterium]|nr:hypothetical protein [Gammaproteobacteria bacterium]
MKACYFGYRILGNKQILTILLTFALSVFIEITHADDYLDALHDEAGKLEYLDESRSSNTISTGKTQLTQEIQQALKNINEFEKYFKKKDSATLAIYIRLSTQERLRIYHRFKSSKDFSLAKKMTIDLYNQRQ